MKKKNAKAIARITCQCGDRAAVFQNTRHYLYTRCPACKCNQDSSPERQVWVWQHMEIVEGGALVSRPRNVPAAAGAPGCALVGPVPLVIIEPEPAPIGEPAGVDLVPAGNVPAEIPEKHAENPQKTLADDLPKEPEKQPEPAPIGAGKQKVSAGVFWTVFTVLSLAAAGVVALATGNSGGSAT